MYSQRREFVKVSGMAVIGSLSVPMIDPASADSKLEYNENRWWTDFRDASLGSSPSNWRRAFDGGLSATIEEATEGQYLRLQKPDSGTDGVIWTTPGSDRQDVELFVEWESLSTSELVNRLVCTARVDQDEETAYLGGHGQTERHRLTKYTPSFSELAATENDGFSPGTRVRQRFRVEDDQLRIKVWKAVAREPDWYWNVSDTSIPEGGEVGLFTWGSSHAATDLRVNRIAAGVEGREASIHDPTANWNQVQESIIFPFAADRDVSYVDGWDELRDEGERVHRATDLYDDYGTPVYAMASGTVRGWMPGITHEMTPGSGGGYQIHIDTDDGDHRHVYAHFGPDKTEHADEAFAPYPAEDRTLEPGDHVQQGQHIGWLGNSGATASGAHLHLEDRCRNSCLSLSDPYGSSDPDDFGYQAGPRWNPYPSLRYAEIQNRYP